MEWLADPAVWASFLTLTVLEIVLGIDNVIFISILVSKLPKEQQPRARRLGLGLALVMRVIFLLCIGFIVKMTYPVIAPFGKEFSWRDLVLLTGGLFLVWKATKEIHHKLEGAEHGSADGSKVVATMGAVVGQIAILDIVFSIDSVITAIGMADKIPVMIAAVVVSIGVMLAFAAKIGSFVEQHPTVKMLALAFLVLIGANLIAEGWGHHIPKGYTYFAMAFSVVVEALNLKMKKANAAPVELRKQQP
jgi:predicted tellurium resistance membrane protein TerC